MSCRVTFILALIFLLFFQGIIRHDMPKEKYLQLASQPQYKCVGKVLYKGVSKGSCVLVGSNKILSAAHVFENMKSNADLQHYSFTFEGVEYTAEHILVHPGYIKSEKQKDDLAIIILTRPVSGISVPFLNTAFDELKNEVTGVGFGASGVGNSTKTKSLAEKIAGNNIIDSIGGYLEDGHSALLLCDFDSPRPTYNPLGDNKPLPLEYITTGGDSGGGLFRIKNGRTELIGILHGGGVDIDIFMRYAYYGQVMEWTRVSCFQKWIIENIK